MDSILPIAQGIASAGFLTHIKREEDSVRYGENHLLTGIYQSAQATQGFYLINRALEAASYSPFSFVATSLMSLTPMAIAYATAQDYFGPDFYLVYDAIGILIHIASIVSSIALITLGQTALGATSLVLLSVGFLDREGILPENIRQVVHLTTYPLTMVAGIFVGDIVTQIYSLINVALLVRTAYQNWMHPEVARRAQEMDQTLPPVSVPVTPDTLQCLQFQALIPNRAHIRYASMPPIPPVDVQQLNQLCNTIDWNERSNQVALDRKLVNDPRWRRRFQGESTCCLSWLRPRSSKEAYLKAQLRLCVDSIQNHEILVGEPTNYELMHNYLKVITDRLPHLSPVARADMLLNLAIDGGQYCGPGKFRVISELYQTVLSDAPPDTSLETRLLTHLQQARVALFQGPIFATVQSLGSANRTILPIGDQGIPLTDIPLATPAIQMLQSMDLSDVHNYNRFLNLVGREVGLPRQGAEEDGSAQLDPLVASTLSPVMREVFWSYNNADAIIASVKEVLGTPAAPILDVYAWWRQWIIRRCPPENQAELLEEMGDGKLFGRPLEEGFVYFIEHNNRQVPKTRMTFTDVFIKAMLLEMGILQYPVALPQNTNPVLQFLITRMS